MTDTTPDAPANSTPPTAPAPRRWLKPLLIASLAVNVLVIGAVAGAGLAFKRHGGSPRGGEDFGLMGFSRHLPPERRNEFRKEIKEARGNLKPLVESLDAARNDVAAKLSADTFDREAIKSAIDKVTENEVKLKDAGRSIFLDQAAKLSPEERRELADWWKQKHARREKRDR